MTGKKIVFSLITLLVAGLWSCTSDELWESPDNREGGAIDLNVGVASSPEGRIATRAGEPTFYAMQAGTQVRLKVDGIWKRISETDPVSQKTTCLTVAATPGAKVNALSFTESELLYWDDYGTGDPDNAASRATPAPTTTKSRFVPCSTPRDFQKRQACSPP